MTTSGGPREVAHEKRPVLPELKLGTKVTMAAAGMVTLLVATSLGAIYAVVGMRHDQQQITRGELDYGEQVDRAALSGKGMANDERGFLLSGRRAFLVEAGQRLVLARHAFDNAERAAADAQQRSAVAEARRGFERWATALFGKEIAAYNRGDRREAVRLSLGETRALRKAYEGSLAAARSLDDAQSAAAQRSITQESARSIQSLVMVLAVAVAVDVAISVWLVRAIALPVSRLVSLMSALAAPDAGKA